MIAKTEKNKSLTGPIIVACQWKTENKAKITLEHSANIRSLTVNKYVIVLALN